MCVNIYTYNYLYRPSRLSFNSIFFKFHIHFHLFFFNMTTYSGYASYSRSIVTITTKM